MQRPLAAALATLLVCTTAHAQSATPVPRVLMVDNCNDSGTGSLRNVVLTADDGDTVDLSNLSCSVISLSTGAIVIGAHDLTLHGPGKDALKITSAGNPGSGVLYAIEPGTLKIDGVTLSSGSKYATTGTAHGGCIFSTGSLQISDSRIDGCSVLGTNTADALGGAVYAGGDVTLIRSVVELSGATSNAGTARGGGVFAGGGLTIAYSTISDCRVSTTQQGYGGGAFVGENVVAKYSTIRDNTVDDSPVSNGGGLISHGNAVVLFSTISGNHARIGGGLYFGAGVDGDVATVVNSTISGNTATAAGGARSRLPLSLANSTIAFNTIPRPYSGVLDYSESAGLGVLAAPVSLNSSIIANNIAEGTNSVPRDVGGRLQMTITGSNNLIGNVGQGAPAGTLTADPLLGPLRNNGGLTATHALRPGSPAIDAGNNIRNFNVDQRGEGFARVLGSQPDIGAYEVDPDRIFDDGFD
ncbi:MAG: choice-of-anchor Q domain-containing protein [Dokdonella sp.]|uniref:choice-of-anchor Q domain-containing protein n=1 Tax=Dokdonella sp. TaxID=2291710 RepID=UPI003263B153